LSIVQRYLPNYQGIPSEKDLSRYAFPLPTTFVWSKDDCSSHTTEVAQLEHEFGFKMRAVFGSLNYLANTAYEELYTIRKACKFIPPSKADGV
jgi:hypothetical protein